MEYNAAATSGKAVSLLSRLLSGLFCADQPVINKCFRCDAIRLAMLEVGQQSALQAGSVRIARDKSVGRTGYQAIGDTVPTPIEANGNERIKDVRRDG